MGDNIAPAFVGIAAACATLAKTLQETARMIAGYERALHACGPRVRHLMDHARKYRTRKKNANRLARQLKKEARRH